MKKALDDRRGTKSNTELGCSDSCSTSQTRNVQHAALSQHFLCELYLRDHLNGGFSYLGGPGSIGGWDTDLLTMN